MRHGLASLTVCLLLSGCSGSGDEDQGSSPSRRDATTITVHLSAPPANDVLFFQDGDRAWQQVGAPVEDNTFQFEVHWSRYAVGWTCQQEATTQYGGSAFYAAAFDYRYTDDDQAPNEQVQCAYEAPPSIPATFSCLDDSRVHAEWSAADTSRYELTVNELPHGDCNGGTHVSCHTDWRASIPAALMGAQPRFDFPAIKDLVAFPTNIHYGCDAADPTLRVGVSAAPN